MRKSLLFLSFILILMSNSLFADGLMTKSIFGDTDWQEVEDYTPKEDSPFSVDFVNQHETRVGIMRDVGCSGTLISRNLFLTAAHCIKEGVLNDAIRFNYQLTNGVSGTFNTETVFNVSEVVECGYNDINTNQDSEGNKDNVCDRIEDDYCACGAFYSESGKNLDYAVLRLEENNGQNAGDLYGWTNLEPTLPEADDPIAIIGHPNWMAKKVDTGIIDNVYSSGKMLSYTLDTLPGNSGSGVLDENGNIIAVHTWGEGPNGANDAFTINQIFDTSEIIRETINRGRARIFNLNSSGTLKSYHPYSEWRRWDHIVPFRTDEGSFVLFYQKTGLAKIYSTSSTGSLMVPIYTHDSWNKWDIITTYETENGLNMLFYNKSGRATIFNVDSDGILRTEAIVYDTSSWSEWDKIVPFKSEDGQRILFYNESGKAKIYRLNSNGTLRANIYYALHWWEWDQIIPYETDEGFKMLFYNKSGRARIHDIDSDGKLGTKIYEHTSWSSWDSIAPYEAEDGLKMLFYSKSSGRASIYNPEKTNSFLKN